MDVGVGVETVNVGVGLEMFREDVVLIRQEQALEMCCKGVRWLLEETPMSKGAYGCAVFC